MVGDAHALVPAAVIHPDAVRLFDGVGGHQPVIVKRTGLTEADDRFLMHTHYFSRILAIDVDEGGIAFTVGVSRGEIDADNVLPDQHGRYLRMRGRTCGRGW